MRFPRARVWASASRTSDTAAPTCSHIVSQAVQLNFRRLRAAATAVIVATTGVPDTDYALVKSQFSEKEIADLTVVIALMNAMNRIGVGSRLTPPKQIS